MSDRTLPYSLEAEESLLGNILLYEEAMQQCVEQGLNSNDFYLDKHRRIFSIMYSMYERKEKIDTVSLVNRLKSLDFFDKVGGMDYILHLTSATISRVNTEEYIRILREKTIARQLIETTSKIGEESYHPSTSIEDLLDEAEKSILGITRSRMVSDFKTGAELFAENVAKIQKIQDAGDTITGLRTLYTDLDRLTTGFQKGDFIILAARPSMGKTALALNFAMNAASISPGAVAIFSLEMPADQLTLRMLSAKSKVPMQKLRTGKLDDSDWSAVNQSVQELRKQKLFLDDSPGIKVAEMFAKCRKLKSEHALSLIVIDYIQLITASGNSDSRQQEVSEISRKLKALARELEVPVIALSQLSRNVEKREDKHPMLSDLRESGALEQDADLIMFIYREAYYNNKKDEENPSTREDVELYLAKHRNGPTGPVSLAFEKDISAFYGIKNNMEFH